MSKLLEKERTGWNFLQNFERSTTDFEIDDIDYDSQAFQSKLHSKLNIDNSIYDNNDILVVPEKELKLRSTLNAKKGILDMNQVH